MKKAMFRFATACLLLLLASAFAARPVAAEGFSIYTIGGDNLHIVGIDAQGDVVLQTAAGCGAFGYSACFLTYANGNLLSSSATLGNFAPDNGAACSFTPPAQVYLVGRSVCNGTQQVVGLFGLSVGDYVGALYAGSDTLGNQVYAGSADVLFLNSAGDFVVADGLHDTIYQVIATPEPAALVLLLTAVAGIWLLGRHRRPTPMG